MKYYFLFFFILFLSGNTFSQKNIWLGIDAGVDYDHFKINDPGGYLSEKPVIAGHIGIFAEKEINNILSIGTGFIFKTYMEEMKYQGESFYAADRAFNSLITPIYLNATKSINDNMFKVLATAGADIVYNFDYWPDDPNDWSDSSTFVTNNGLTISDNFYGTANLKRVFYLLHAGGGIEFQILDKYRLAFMVKRHFGFTNVIEISTDYTTNGISHPTAHMNSKGGFTSTSLQFFYPLNNNRN